MNKQQVFSTTSDGLSLRRVFTFTANTLSVDTYITGPTEARNKSGRKLLLEASEYERTEIDWPPVEPQKTLYRCFINGHLITSGVQRRGGKMKERVNVKGLLASAKQ